VGAQNAGMPGGKAHALAAMILSAYRDFINDLAEKSPLEILRTRIDLQAQVENFGDADLEAKILGKLVKADKGGKASSELPGIETDSTLYELSSGQLQAGTWPCLASCNPCGTKGLSRSALYRCSAGSSRPQGRRLQLRRHSGMGCGQAERHDPEQSIRPVTTRLISPIVD
jgi:hypothetical protein